MLVLYYPFVSSSRRRHVKIHPDHVWVQPSHPEHSPSEGQGCDVCSSSLEQKGGEHLQAPREETALKWEERKMEHQVSCPSDLNKHVLLGAEPGWLVCGPPHSTVGCAAAVIGMSVRQPSMQPRQLPISGHGTARPCVLFGGGTLSVEARLRFSPDGRHFGFLPVRVTHTQHAC